MWPLILIIIAIIVIGVEAIIADDKKKMGEKVEVDEFNIQKNIWKI